MKRWAPLLAAALALACGTSERGPAFATSESFSALPRQAPSFAPEAAQALQASPVEDEPGLTRVTVPLDAEAAQALVGRFFSAVLSESTSELTPLFAAQAWVVSESGRLPAFAAWRARFAQLDYTSLAGRIVAPPQTLHTYTYQTAARAKQDGVPAPLASEEVVVVARPGLTWAGKTRLFGEELAFRLRPKADTPGYEIAEIVEDFRLP